MDPLPSDLLLANRLEVFDANRLTGLHVDSFENLAVLSSSHLPNDLISLRRSVCINGTQKKLTAKRSSANHNWHTPPACC